MKRIYSIILLALTVLTTVNAQEFLTTLREKQSGKGKVTVSQSKEIDDLVNGKKTIQTVGDRVIIPQQQQSVQTPQHKASKTATETSSKTNTSAATPRTGTTDKSHATTTEKPANSTAARNTADAAATTKKENYTTKQSVKDNEDYTIPSVDTSKKVMRRSYRMQGYRIQVFSGGNTRQDKQKAYNAGAVMKANFPDQPVYAHFKTPSWKCRMGNFKSQYEAQKLLPKVKKLGFSQACVVKDNIQVQY